jgi:hypothetical protein
MPDSIRRLVRVLASVSMLSVTLVCLSARAANANAVWSAPSAVDTNDLSSVSCPTARFCAAVDDDSDTNNLHGSVLTYNGTSWSASKDIDNAYWLLDSVSCASATFCVAVDFAGNAVIYNGSSWSTPSKIDPNNGSSSTSVSCPSSTFCVAVTAEGYALIYNGSSWSAPVDRRFELSPFGVVPEHQLLRRRR